MYIIIIIIRLIRDGEKGEGNGLWRWGKREII